MLDVVIAVFVFDVLPVVVFVLLGFVRWAGDKSTTKTTPASPPIFQISDRCVSSSTNMQYKLCARHANSEPLPKKKTNRVSFPLHRNHWIHDTDKSDCLEPINCWTCTRGYDARLISITSRKEFKHANKLATKMSLGGIPHGFFNFCHSWHRQILLLLLIESNFILPYKYSTPKHSAFYFWSYIGDVVKNTYLIRKNYLIIAAQFSNILYHMNIIYF